jgi:hypothetical protein
MQVKKKEETTEVDIEQRNKRLGVDMKFNEQKHAYVLTFPWNFPEIISDYEQGHRPVSTSSFWHKFVMNNSIYEFNTLFREFH